MKTWTYVVTMTLLSGAFIMPVMGMEESPITTAPAHETSPSSSDTTSHTADTQKEEPVLCEWDEETNSYHPTSKAEELLKEFEEAVRHGVPCIKGKDGRYTPSLKFLNKIAKYLNVLSGYERSKHQNQRALSVIHHIIRITPENLIRGLGFSNLKSRFGEHRDFKPFDHTQYGANKNLELPMEILQEILKHGRKEDADTLKNAARVNIPFKEAVDDLQKQRKTAREKEEIAKQKAQKEQLLLNSFQNFFDKKGMQTLEESTDDEQTLKQRILHLLSPVSVSKLVLNTYALIQTLAPDDSRRIEVEKIFSLLLSKMGKDFKNSEDLQEFLSSREAIVKNGYDYEEKFGLSFYGPTPSMTPAEARHWISIHETSIAEFEKMSDAEKTTWDYTRMRNLIDLIDRQDTLAQPLGY